MVCPALRPPAQPQGPQARRGPGSFHSGPRLFLHAVSLGHPVLEAQPVTQPPLPGPPSTWSWGPQGRRGLEAAAGFLARALVSDGDERERKRLTRVAGRVGLTA